MCGIVGYIGPKNPTDILIDGLKRLEYRGYDSAGLAVVNNGSLGLRRAKGKILNLQEKLREEPLEGNYGIGHTRWATHGRPSEENAHPHTDSNKDLVVVHNGIIENYLPLKKELAAKGHKFVTETDTETVAHLVSDLYEGCLEDAVRKAVRRLHGIFALAVIHTSDPEKIVCARSGPPLIVGLGEADGEFFVASDVPAILQHTRDIITLGDGEMAVVTKDGCTMSTFDGEAVERDPERITWDPIQAEKAGYKHFMLKEIHEQPRAIQETLVGRISVDQNQVCLEEIGLSDLEIRAFKKVNLLACGTSWHAGLVAKFMLEGMARIPVEVDYGSEYRYRNPIIDDDTLTIVITQSGETADTLAALRETKDKGSKSLAICNVVGSMVTREVDGTIITHAGPEIGVASTKAFTTQLLALYLVALHMGQVRGHIDDTTMAEKLDQLQHLATKMEAALQTEDDLRVLAKKFHKATDFLFLGRGPHYPIALEGALKLKEISYIHAEGYPAGEMKHGPIALIDENLPVVCVCLQDAVYEKMLANLKEVNARDGITIAVVTEGDTLVAEEADYTVPIPEAGDPFLNTILSVVPFQLLSYHIAVLRGCDVDQPRNLAKSVTVE